MSASAVYEALSDYEKAAIHYSDYFKEVNGFRPRGCLMPATLEEIEAAILSLDNESESERLAEEQYERDIRDARRKADFEYKQADTRFDALLKLK